jgi:hypothetical protein
MQQPEIPVVVPAPAPPVPLVLKPAEVAEEDPNRAAPTRPQEAPRGRFASGRTRTQTHARRLAPVELRWEPAPRLDSEPPRWGTP